MQVLKEQTITEQPFVIKVKEEVCLGIIPKLAWTAANGWSVVHSALFIVKCCALFVNPDTLVRNPLVCYWTPIIPRVSMWTACVCIQWNHAFRVFANPCFIFHVYFLKLFWKWVWDLGWRNRGWVTSNLIELCVLNCKLVHCAPFTKSLNMQTVSRWARVTSVGCSVVRNKTIVSIIIICIKAEN